MSFFEEAKEHYMNANETVDENLLNVLKKTWINFNISSVPERNKNKRYGTLTEEYLLTLATDNCRCCGRKLWYGRCSNGMTAEQKEDGYVEPSLDRIDNSLSKEEGYIDSNLWIICRNCNTKKNNAMHPDELINIANAWITMSNTNKKLYENYCKENLNFLNI